jgi:hypothetical protein
MTEWLASATRSQRLLMVRKSSSVSLGNLSNLNCSDGKEARQVMTQTANDVDQVKRSSSPNLNCTGHGNLRPRTLFQKPNYRRTSTNGSPHRIHRLTTTLRAVLITRKWRLGSFKAVFSGNGSQQVRSFGFTGNVCSVPLIMRYSSMTS